MATFTPPLTESEVTAAFPRRFTTVATIFAGGQGAVFRCLPTSGLAQAVKVYAPDPSGQIDERTDREVQTLRRISCSSMVTLEDDGYVVIRGVQCRFVITPFIDGESLASRLARGAVPLQGSARIAVDVAAAIQALWEPERIVHRDIKPPNIMLATGGRAVLIDLGIARHTALVSLTATGSTWGTRGYQSPEHHACRKGLTCKSDIFALGVVLQEAMKGTHPTGGNQHLLMTTSITTSLQCPDVPASVATFVDSMLDRNPVRRPMPEQVIAFFRGHLQDPTVW